MSATVLDGKKIGRMIEEQLHNQIINLQSRDIFPHLAVVIVGDDPASHVYVRNKEMACERCGIKSTRIDLDGEISEEEILSWEPDKTQMPESGRVMYRIDTTLIEPIRTSILCGKCGNIYWEEGVKPKSFDCPDCLITLWYEEEE